MPDEAKGQRPRVLILGGGFAGVGAAKALKDADVEVVLIDKHDYHTFQPLLYQVATALLETPRSDTRYATCSTRNRTSPFTRRPSPRSTWTSARCSSPRWPR